jgi:hypothetical protein
MDRDTRGGPGCARVEVDVMRRSERDRQLSFSRFDLLDEGGAGGAARSTVREGASDTPGRRYERLQRLISIPINLAKERQCSLVLFQSAKHLTSRPSMADASNTDGRCAMDNSTKSSEHYETAARINAGV